VTEDAQRRKEIGALIAEVRKGRGWTQAVLANRLAVNKSVISRLESGQRTPDVARVRALVRELKFTPEQEIRLWQLHGAPTLVGASTKTCQGAAVSDDHVESLVTGLPPHPDDYVEDVDLQRDVRRLCESARLALIHGMPGSGKTTLAGDSVHAIMANEQPVRSRSVWLDAGRGDTIDGVRLCAAILHGLGESKNKVGGLSPEDAVSVALGALARERTVLVLDRFDTVLSPDGGVPEDVELLLGGLAACASTTTVIISRIPVASAHIGHRQTFHVAGLSVGAAERLAVTLFPTATEDVTQPLARRVAYHPLAMVLLRRYVATTRGMRVGDVVADVSVWGPALRRVAGAILQDTDLSQEQVCGLRFLSALRLPLDPVVARCAAIAGVENPVGDVLSSLERMGLVYVDKGWIVHPVAYAYVYERQVESRAYHIDAARMYEAATIRFKDSARDTSTWWPWTLECAYHALMAGNVEHAHDVLDRYRPTSHYLEDGRIDAVHALWASLKASRAQFDAQGDVAGTRSACAHLPTFAVQDMVIAAMYAGDHDAVHELLLPLCNEKAGRTEDLIRVCIRYASVMCCNGAADVALKLVRATHGQLVLVDRRAFPSLHIALLLTEAKVAFERCDATGAIALCHETIEECARYQGETRTLADDKNGARGLVGKFLARATGSAGTASPGDINVDARLIAEMPAYARCMQAVCLFALQRQNDAYSCFDETLEMVEATDGIGSDIHLFVLDHYATCLMSAREYDRALLALQQRVAGMHERRREDARVSGAAGMDVERASYSNLAVCRREEGSPSRGC